MQSQLVALLGYTAGALTAWLGGWWAGRLQRCPMTTCSARPGERHTVACIARRAGWGEDVEDEARAAGIAVDDLRAVIGDVYGEAI
jgi:hypothetical protein